MCWRVCICGLSCEPSLTVTALAITGLSTPQALPRAGDKRGRGGEELEGERGGGRKRDK